MSTRYIDRFDDYLLDINGYIDTRDLHITELPLQGYIFIIGDIYIELGSKRYKVKIKETINKNDNIGIPLFRFDYYFFDDDTKRRVFAIDNDHGLAHAHPEQESEEEAGGQKPFISISEITDERNIVRELNGLNFLKLSMAFLMEDYDPINLSFCPKKS